MKLTALQYKRRLGKNLPRKDVQHNNDYGRVVITTRSFVFVDNFEVRYENLVCFCRELGNSTSHMHTRLSKYKRRANRVFETWPSQSLPALYNGRPSTRLSLRAALPSRNHELGFLSAWKKHSNPVVLFNYTNWLYRHAYMNISLLENCSDMYGHVWHGASLSIFNGILDKTFAY